MDLGVLAFILFCLCSVVSCDHRPQGWNAIARAYPSVRNESRALELARLIRLESINYLKDQKLDGERVAAPFNCPITGRSNPRPVDARKLLPGDIDVVITLGDSIAAAFGALADSIFRVFTEYRGYSFSTGGETDLDAFVTLPNIIKKYNPNVKGFSIGNGDQDSSNAMLNIAVSGARSYDLASQVVSLAAKLKRMGITNADWKLVTIFIGGNNLCDFCTDGDRNSPDSYQKDLEATLDSIQSQFPRTFVNLISPPDVTLLNEVSGGLCSLLHSYECGCADDASTSEAHADYMVKLEEVARLPKYSSRADFHVSFQPFFKNFTLPRLPDGNPDRTFFAPDCFHFSGKAHEAAAIALWNNMCETTANKKTYWVPGERLECPQKYLK